VVLCISTLFVGQYSKMARAVCDVMFLIAYCTVLNVLDVLDPALY
jgi:hypothetical protein